MTRHAGFTVVELILTITIMAVLMTVAVVGLRSTQANGRDVERKSDTDIIARSLEQFYISTSSTGEAVGRYIGTSAVTVSTLGSLMPDLSQDALHAPQIATTDPISLVPATNAVQTAAGVSPQPTTSTYVYQPLTYNSGTSTYSLCTNHLTTECRKFNLYYRLEKTADIQMIVSKQQ